MRHFSTSGNLIRNQNLFLEQEIFVFPTQDPWLNCTSSGPVLEPFFNFNYGIGLFCSITNYMWNYFCKYIYCINEYVFACFSIFLHWKIQSVTEIYFYLLSALIIRIRFQLFFYPVENERLILLAQFNNEL